MKAVFDGYTVNLHLDNEGEYLACFSEMPNISAFGDTPEEALQELENAWNLMKEDYLASGETIPAAPSRKRYSGSFNVRIDKKLHRDLAIEAAQAGISLNALVAKKL